MANEQERSLAELAEIIKEMIDDPGSDNDNLSALTSELELRNQVETESDERGRFARIIEQAKAIYAWRKNQALSGEEDGSNDAQFNQILAELNQIKEDAELAGPQLTLKRLSEVLENYFRLSKRSPEINALIMEIRQEASGVGAANPEAAPQAAPHSESIDIHNWPENQHPSDAVRVGRLTLSIGRRLTQEPDWNPSNDDEVDELIIFLAALKEVIEKEAVKGSTPGNKKQVALFLKNRYVRPADQVLRDVEQRSKNLEAAEFQKWKDTVNNRFLRNLFDFLSRDFDPALAHTFGEQLAFMSVEETKLNRLLDRESNESRRQYLKDILSDIEMRREQIKREVKTRANTQELGIYRGAIAEFDKKIREILDTIDLDKIAPHSTDADAKNEEQVIGLKQQLIALKIDAESRGFFDRDKYQANSLIIREINALVGEDDASGRYWAAINHADKAIAHARSERKLKPVDQLSWEELAAEMLEGNIDPTLYDYGRADPNERRGKLSVRFNSFKPELESKGDYEMFQRYCVLKTDINLLRLNQKLDDGTGAASADRDKLFPTLKAYQFRRKELLAATTHHTVWGEQVRDILRFLIEEGARENIFKYEDLGGESGQTKMEQFCSLYFPEAHPKAVAYAQMMFASFDMLSITFQQAQLKTRTRMHNVTNELDPVTFTHPLASYIHKAERYNDQNNWLAWFLLYFEHIPNNGEYGPGGNAHAIQEKQHMVQLHQECYFPTEDIAGKIRLPGFCQSLFPNTYDLVTLQRFEKIGLIDDESVDDFAKYEVSLMGWKDLLELTFANIPEGIKIDQIISGSDDEGPLLNRWFAAAGKLKVWGNSKDEEQVLNKVLESMLTHYIYRLFQHFVGDRAARNQLKTKVDEGLRRVIADERGLASYASKVQNVIRNINKPNVLVKGLNYRHKQRRKYLKAWWREENHKRPPMMLAGYGLRPFAGPDYQQYYEWVNGTSHHAIPRPANRKGSLSQNKDKL